MAEGLPAIHRIFQLIFLLKGANATHRRAISYKTRYKHNYSF
nr:MAG TPA: hypothetical protein [Bacteriophage sp.]